MQEKYINNFYECKYFFDKIWFLFYKKYLKNNN